jgi:hypothetical protein
MIEKHCAGVIENWTASGFRRSTKSGRALI